MTLQRFSHAGAAPATGLSGSITATTTSFSILSGTGYPTGSGGPFVCVIDQGTASEEKILVASITSNTVTVQGGVSGRGYDGTSAASHNGGTTNFEHVFGAVEADDDNSHIYDTTRNDHTQYVLYSGVTGTMITPSGNGTAMNLAVSLNNTASFITSNATVSSATNIAQLTGLTTGATYLINARTLSSVNSSNGYFNTWLYTGSSFAVIAATSGYLNFGSVNPMITTELSTIRTMVSSDSGSITLATGPSNTSTVTYSVLSDTADGTYANIVSGLFAIRIA